MKTLRKFERRHDKTTRDLAKAMTLKDEADHNVREMDDITKRARAAEDSKKAVEDGITKPGQDKATKNTKGWK
jgi:hypothetical protein